VRSYVENEEMFLANYSDGLTDMDLDWMAERFRRTDKIAAFIAVRPPISMHFVQNDAQGRLTAFSNAQSADIWINGGFFIMRPEIFEYMREGEDLVPGCFARLIAEDKLLALRHESFWCAMDTLKDKQLLEELLEKTQVPWRLSKPPSDVTVSMGDLLPDRPDEARPKLRRL
jgi:glucose-1-phosphate cytidylyltransferase